MHLIIDEVRGSSEANGPVRPEIRVAVQMRSEPHSIFRMSRNVGWQYACACGAIRFAADPGTLPFPLFQFQCGPVSGRILHDPQCRPPAREIRPQVLPDMDHALCELLTGLAHDDIDLPFPNA